jgi:hypothetical protein
MLLEFTNCEVPELEAETIAFGPEKTGPNDKFEVEVGEQPIGLSLRGLGPDSGLPIEADLAPLFKRFDLWLIPHRIHIRRVHGIHELVSVTINVRYDAEGGTCSVVSLFPEAQFVVLGTLEAHASVDAAGSMSPLPGSLADTKNVGGSLDIGTAGGIKASMAFRTSISSPLISTGGKGSSRCSWTFEQHETPLFGRDIETWSVLVLPRRRKSVRYSMSVGYTQRLFVVPAQRTTNEVEISCPLVGPDERRGSTPSAP